MARAALAAVARTAAVVEPPGPTGGRLLLQRTWRGGCPSSSHTPDGALSSLLGREHLTRPAARRAGCAAAAAVACSGVTHAGCLASMMGTGLYAQRFAVGVLPPSSSRAAFASFSSRDRTTSSFEAAKRVNGKIGASTGVGKLLRVVRDSHEDFNDANVATAWSKLAKVTGRGRQGRTRSSDYIANTVQVLSMGTPLTAGEMKPQELSNTLVGYSKAGGDGGGGGYGGGAGGERAGATRGGWVRWTLKRCRTRHGRGEISQRVASNFLPSSTDPRGARCSHGHRRCTSR